MSGHKTTVMLKPEVWLRLRNRAQREQLAVGTLINLLLEHALVEGPAGDDLESIGAGSSDIDDLGTNAHKHLRELAR